MFLHFRSSSVLALLLLFTTTVSAGNPLQEPAGFKSVDELFAAYVAAEQKRDWKAIFRLGTPKRQRLDVLELLYMSLPMADEEDDLKAILVGNGLPWKKLHGILTRWQQADPEGQDFDKIEIQQMSEVDAMIAANVKNPAKLYADMYGFRGGPSPLKDLKLKNLVENGNVATAQRTYRQLLKITMTSGDNAGQEYANEVASSDGPIVFRRVNGMWFYGLADETVKQMSALLGQAQEVEKQK